MYNTPNSRTSKHGSSKRSQQRSRQSKSRSSTLSNQPVASDIASIMDTPLETEVEVADVADEVTVGAVGAVEEANWLGESMISHSEETSAAVESFDPFTNAIDLDEDNAEPLFNFGHSEVVDELESHDYSVQYQPNDEIETEQLQFHDDNLVPNLTETYDTQETTPPPDLSADAHNASFSDPVPAFSGPESGHVRAPMLVQKPTSPSSLSRQLQNVQSLLPSSPQLPSFGLSNLSLASFSAPRISTVTASGTNFHNTHPRVVSDLPPSPRETRRRSTGAYAERERDRSRLGMISQTVHFDESDDEDAMPVMPGQRRMRYPSNTPAVHDRIVFTSFASLYLSRNVSSFRRLLFIGYDNGLQVWDATHLGEVQEILNRRISGAVVACCVFPTPTTSADPFSEQRPLIGIAIEKGDMCKLVAYSLASHKIVKKLDFSGASVTSFQASNSFIAVATVNPTALHILSAQTLDIIHSFFGRQLNCFARPILVPSQQPPYDRAETTYASRQDRPHVVFALTGRLLAFSSRPPSQEPATQTLAYPRMATTQSPSIQLGPLNVSQADVSNAALRVGSGLLSGMKALGGMAVAAARGDSVASPSSEKPGGFRGLFFSRSAPATSSRHPYSGSPASSVSGHGDETEDRESGQHSKLELVAHVTIVDLQPLLESQIDRPDTVSEFSIPNSQPISGLKFSEDGTTLSVVPTDGLVVRVYSIKPRSRAVRSQFSSELVRKPATVDDSEIKSVRRRSATATRTWITEDGRSGQTEIKDLPWHLYDLRRGRTSGVIESVESSVDERWMGVTTRKRTIHVFATNPYGGKADEASHIEGRVKNTNSLQPLSIELKPLVRLRSTPVISQEQLSVPVAFSFIHNSSTSVPRNLLPSHTTFSNPSSVASSLPSSPPRRQHSVSPRLPPIAGNFQDMLVFDPIDGSLSLRRLNISSRVNESSTTLLSAIPIPSGTSMSLPGKGLIGWSNSSPPKPSAASAAPSPSTEANTELTGKDTSVATWSLMRNVNWKEVKAPLVQEVTHDRTKSFVSKSEWLAQAELLTCSRSTAVLPSSIYLSHQFSFYALESDYHALVRRSHFDTPTVKIEVRREVEASAYSSTLGDGFLQSGSSPHDSRQSHSPLDGPLASAISAGLDYSGTSPPVIPMLPNGARPGSFKATIPIRHVAAGLSDGVNEGIERLRREMKKARSPRLTPRSEENAPGPVPLEFNEEDEAFLSQTELGHNEDDLISNSGATSHGAGDSGTSISTPSSNDNAPLPGNDLDGWSPEDVEALEEAERFDEISAAGFMDEEQFQIRSPRKGSAGRNKG